MLRPRSTQCGARLGLARRWRGRGQLLSCDSTGGGRLLVCNFTVRAVGRAVVGELRGDWPASFGQKPSQMDCGGVVAERVGAPVSSLGAYEVTVPREQIAELDRGARMAALDAAAIRGRGGRDSPLVLEQNAEVRGAGWITSSLGVTVSDGGGLERSSFGEEAPEPERSVGVPALVGAAVGCFCAWQITLFLQQKAKVGGGRRLTALVGTTVRRLGGGEITPARECATESDRSVGVPAFVGAAVGCFCAW